MGDNATMLPHFASYMNKIAGIPLKATTHLVLILTEVASSLSSDSYTRANSASAAGLIYDYLLGLLESQVWIRDKISTL